MSSLRDSCYLSLRFCYNIVIPMRLDKMPNHYWTYKPDAIINVTVFNPEGMIVL